MKWLWFGSFACGAALFWAALLSPHLSARRRTVRELIAQYWKRGAAGYDGLAGMMLPEITAAERAYIEKARLAGIGWAYRSFARVRRGAALAGAYLWMAATLPGLDGGAGVFRAGVGAIAAAGACWCIPALTLSALAARRRSLVLAEISKFAHRMSICIEERNDLRDLILRAGRPLKLLKPALQRLAAQWGNDQREAILDFRDAVGISEAYPLVNAFSALSRAKSADIKRLLDEHARSIDSTLEAEMTKRIENAPVWISFYIMIPFMVCLVLFVYPWMSTVLEQLAVSFSP